MPRAPEEEKEYRREVGQKIVDFFNARLNSLTSLADFENLTDEIRHKIIIDETNPATGNPIPSADLDIFKNVFEYLFEKPDKGINKVWREAFVASEDIYKKLRTKIGGAYDKLSLSERRERMADVSHQALEGYEKHGRSETEKRALAIALARLDQELIANSDIEKTFDEKSSYMMRTWNAFKKYVAERNSAGGIPDEDDYFDTLHRELGTPLPGGGVWTNPDVRNLFEVGYKVEQLLEQGGADGVWTDDELQDLNRSMVRLAALSSLSTTGSSETELVYQRLKTKQNKILEQLTSRINTGFMEGIAKELEIYDRDEEFRVYAKALNRLVTKIEKLAAAGISLHNLSSSDRTELEKELNAVKSGEEFLTDNNIGKTSREIVEIVHNRAVTRAETILGIQTQELNEIFTDDVKYWLMGNYRSQWRTVQRYWELKKMGNLGLLTQYDVNVLNATAHDFKDAVGRLIEDQEIHEDDAFLLRYLALDIQLNRIQEMLDEKEKADKARAATTPEAAASSPQADLIGSPDVDAESNWKLHFRKLLIEAESNPEIYTAILNEIRRLILERLNLSFESTNPNFKDGPRYRGLSSLPGVIEELGLDKSSPHANIIEQIKKKAAEMEYVRTITDMAHMGGVSDAMSSEWSKAAEFTGSNNLQLYHYDYFSQEFGGRIGDIEETYEHWELVHNTLHEFLRWLRFGEGKKWADGQVWKGKAKKHLRAFFIKLAKDKKIELSAYDIEEIWGLIYNISCGLGIRQHSFLDQYAQGATPAGAINFSWVEKVNPVARDRYRTYKDPRYNPSAEFFTIPDRWKNLMGVNNIGDRARLNNIHKSIALSNQLVKIIAPLRERVPIGTPEQGFDGEDISTGYQSLFEFVFLDANRRKKFKDANKDVTFRDFIAGHEAFAEFVEYVYKSPGDLVGQYEEQVPAEEIIKRVVERINSFEVDNLVGTLINAYQELITTYVSNLKKNLGSADPNQVAHSIIYFIDKSFRILALHDNVNNTHYNRLLNQIRTITMAAANMKGMFPRKTGETYPIYGLRDREQLAFRETKEFDEYGRSVSTEVRKDEDYDVRDFILNRIPQTVKGYQGKNILATLASPVANAVDKPMGMVGNYDDRRRASPTDYGNGVEGLHQRIKMFFMRRRLDVSDTFGKTAYHVFGIPVKDQRRTPDS